jgi:hypothetical protein
LQFRIKLRRRDWQGMKSMLRPLAQAAQQCNDHRLLTELAYAAFRLDEPQLGAQLLYTSRATAGKIPSAAWRGEDLRDATLIIHVMETATQGVAVGLPHVGQIAAAIERAGRAVIVAEPRMVPLFARSFHEAIVVPYRTDLAPYQAGKFVTANTNDLEISLGYDEQSIARAFRPLVADGGETIALRQRYRGDRTIPLIGIAWSSTHYGKELAPPSAWTRLLRAMPAQFVSLQYGDVQKDVAKLNGGNLIVDPAVDQLRDMDRFASQIAALDLVITISNSGAHLAGALGKPMILVRDDLFRRNWPYLSRRVPWYPQALVIGKDGRPWDAVFDEVAAEARLLISEQS